MIRAIVVIPVLAALSGCSQPTNSGAGGAGAAGSSGSTNSAGGAPACIPGDAECDPENCGAPHHDCLGGACTAGACQPVALVGEDVLPPLVITADAVYGDHREPDQGQLEPPCGAEWVFRVSQSSDTAEQFASRRVDALLADDTYLYFWAYNLKSFECEREPKDTLWRMPLAGGAPQLIGDPTDSGQDPHLRNGRIYELAVASGMTKYPRQFESFPVTGGPATTIGAAFDDGPVALLDVDDTSIVWWGSVGTKGLGVVRAMSIADGAIRTIVDKEPIDDVIVDEEFVYYASLDAMTKYSSVFRVPRAGGAPQTIYHSPDGQNRLLRVVGDELVTSSYRLVDGHQSLVAIPRAGGAPRTVLDGYGVSELLADDTALYFVGGTGGQDNTLYRLAR